MSGDHAQSARSRFLFEVFQFRAAARTPIVESESGVFQFAEDQALVDEFLEWLGRAHVAEVEEDLVPEPRVEEVQHRVFCSSHIKVHTTGLRVPRTWTLNVGR